MIHNTGYLVSVEEDLYIEHTRPLLVTSCGFYKLLTLHKLETLREQGRQDWQIVYLAGGSGYFYLDGVYQKMKQGNCIVYRPGQRQQYYYRKEDNPEIYWVHFSGTDIQRIFSECAFPDSLIQQIGINPEFSRLFDTIIRELQIKQPGFEQMCCGLLQEFLVLAARCVTRFGHNESKTDILILSAVEDICRNFSKDIPIEVYAQKYNMSICWFIRRFKAATGSPPQQFIIHLRISKAKELCETTSLNMTEIAALTGYQNPLYFSRIFKKYVGRSPSEYRNTGNR